MISLTDILPHQTTTRLAALGTHSDDEARQVLLSAGVGSLKRMAGYTAPTGAIVADNAGYERYPFAIEAIVSMIVFRPRISFLERAGCPRAGIAEALRYLLADLYIDMEMSNIFNDSLHYYKPPTSPRESEWLYLLAYHDRENGYFIQHSEFKFSEVEVYPARSRER